MATGALSVRRDSSTLSKYVVFGVIGLMTAYVLWHKERFLIDASDPIWKHYHPFRWWLLPHGIAGACTILLGPMQFFDDLRQRLPGLHRIVGRIYVAGALVAAPLGAYIQYFQERMGAPRSFSAAAMVDAVLLTTTTAIAFGFILRGKVQQHRAWMTRSFAVALVFLEVRVVLGVTGWERLGTAAIETAVWSCMALSLLLADIALQWEDGRRLRPKAAPNETG